MPHFRKPSTFFPGNNTPFENYSINITSISLWTRENQENSWKRLNPRPYFCSKIVLSSASLCHWYTRPRQNKASQVFNALPVTEIGNQVALTNYILTVLKRWGPMNSTRGHICLDYSFRDKIVFYSALLSECVFCSLTHLHIHS